MAPPRPPAPPGIVVQMLALATGHAFVVPLFAKLGIADLLPRSGADLAEATGLRPDALSRMLAFCTCIGLITEHGGLFALTEEGQMLRTPAFKDEAAARGEASYLAGWQNLEGILRGTPPEPSPAFAELRRARTAVTSSFALTEYAAGFKRSETYVDIGSGDASLLEGILKASPRSEGAYVGRETELARIKADLKAAGVAHRCDFLAPAPALPAGDAFVISNRLEELGDDAAVALIGRCRAAMRPNGRVLVIGPLARDQYERRLGTTALADLEMLLFTSSGTCRGEDELRALCTRGGLTPKTFTRAHHAYVLEASASS